MAINLNALRVFTAVVERGGFSRAAEALRISQPAVSKAVRELERQVGIELLDRRQRVARPTDAGAMLAERGRELFATERLAEEELRAARGLSRGTLRIAASTTIATYLLPPLLAAYHRKWPGISLVVASANTRRVARLLTHRRVDVALVEGPVADPRIDVVPWREDELIIVAPASHPLARRRSLSPDALAHESFIVREPGSGTRAVAHAALRDAGVRARTALVLGSTEAIKQAVIAGLGLAIVSREACVDQLAAGRLAQLRLTGLKIRRPFTRLVLRGVRAPGAVVAFEEILANDS